MATLYCHFAEISSHGAVLFLSAASRHAVVQSKMVRRTTDVLLQRPKILLFVLGTLVRVRTLRFSGLDGDNKTS